MPIEARTDLERLKHYLDVPAAKSARWVVLPRGNPSSVVPGPTDTVLYALVEIPAKAWSELGHARAPETVALPEDVAHALLGAQAVSSFTGPAYDVSKRVLNPYRGEHGIRVRDGLLVVLYTL